VLTFITTIRHPARSTSYERVWDLLRDTTRSLCAQTDDEFRVVVVCDRARQLSDDPRVHVVTVDWPPVDKKRANGDYKCRSALLDKGTKFAVGLGYVRQLGTDHVMFCDADDFVARDIAAYVNQHPDANGWVLERGYVLTPKALTALDRFNKLCGTSHIIQFELVNAGIPEGLDPTWPVDLVMAVMDKGFLIHILGNHQQAGAWLASEGRPLEAYPSRAAVWHLGTGENVSNIRKQSEFMMRDQPEQLLLPPELQERVTIPDHRVPAGVPQPVERD
jgi:hypothetical protein